MTATTTTKISEGNSGTTVQADVVHGGVYIYNTPPDATPEERFRVGVRYLDGGMPSRALDLIDSAAASGHATAELHFYWILALLSGRTLHQLTDGDMARLRHALSWTGTTDNDEWAAGLRMIQRLLAAMQNAGDPKIVIKEFEELGARQREPILRHLEMFLDGEVEDALWQRALAQARKDQTGGDRRDRVWMFFQPEPAGVRTTVPVPPEPVGAGVIKVRLLSTVACGAVGFLGLLTVLHRDVSSMAAFLLSVAGGYAAVRSWLRTRCAAERLREEERRYRLPHQQSPAGRGFAADLDRLFARYADRYLPTGVEPAYYLQQTAGVRRLHRDEIERTYRESGVSARRIAWLVRHRISDIRTDWQRGRLWTFREELTVSWRTRAAFWLGLALLLPSACWALVGALQTGAAGASLALLVAAGSGWAALTRRLALDLATHRHRSETARCARVLAGDEAAYERWTRKLARRPTDSEMAVWLDCDRKILMEAAMQHYRLAPSHVLASAFIEGPAAGTKRARVHKGPWRYSRYRIVIFLLTQDGVRQMTAESDFERVTFSGRERANYRYDAVASVRVSEPARGQPTFELTLVNGRPVDIRVSEADIEFRDDASAAEEATLDSTGLRNTLHVLEGIAAEGREWVRLERSRGAGRVSVLRAAVDGMLT